MEKHTRAAFVFTYAERQHLSIIPPRKAFEYYPDSTSKCVPASISNAGSS